MAAPTFIWPALEKAIREFTHLPISAVPYVQYPPERNINRHERRKNNAVFFKNLKGK